MKRHAPATLRNSAHIADVLAKELPKHGKVLEIASGSGEHAVYYGRAFPELQWQPSDHDPEALLSIQSWVEEEVLANVAKPIQLDAMAAWSNVQCDAIFCCNMIHISPWAATQGLFRNAGALLGKDGPLILYGPFLEVAVETAPSNEAFDESLRSRNPDWGIRAVADLNKLAADCGLGLSARHQMPANNLMLIYRA